MRLLFLSIFTAFALLSCNDGPSAIGSDFFEDGSLDVVYVDSLTVKVSTVGFDSLITSDATRLLVGYHSDANIGKLQSSAIFQISPEGALTADEDFTTYSRATIVLVPDGYSYYDTTSYISLSVHELNQKMELNDGLLYNTSSFTYNENSIGTLTFLPKPNSSDTLEIPLASSFGNKIFSMAQQEAEEVSTATAFIEEFKGIAIVPNTASSGAILGYGASPEVRIYYWDHTQTPSEEKYLTIKGGGHIKYNKISYDREGTPLSLIENQEASLSSELTNNIGFIQAGSGLALRVDIPYLKSILLENEGLTIANAVLEFYPVREKESNMALPESFDVGVVNHKNDFYSSQSLQAYLIRDEYLDRDTRYEIEVRSFVLAQLATEELNKNALLFLLDDAAYRQSADFIRIADQQGEKKMKLKLYCVVLKK